MQGVPQQLQNEENYGNFEADSNKPFEDKSKMFDTAESKNIGVDCEELNSTPPSFTFFSGRRRHRLPNTVVHRTSSNIVSRQSEY